MPSFWQKIAAACLIGILLLIEVAAVAAATSGGQVTLPAPPPRPGMTVPNPSGLTISIDTTWLQANGYRPVQIKVASIVPATSDRTLQIRLTPFGDRGWMYASSVQIMRTIDLPAASGGETATIPVPQWDAWQSLSLEVLEDGKRIDALSSGDVLVNSGIANAQTYTTATTLGKAPAVLLLGVSANAADAVKNWITTVGADDQLGTFRQANFMSAGAIDPPGPTTGPLVSSIPIAKLPERWLDYTGFDVVLVPLDKLGDAVKNHPAQWSAIRRTVAAGGNLWVYGIGDNLQRLAELEELLDLGPQSPAAGEPANTGLGADWQKPEPRPSAATVPSSAANENGPTGAPSATPGRPTAPAFVSRRFGLGQIVAIGTDDVFTDGKFDWYWLMNTVRANRWQWTARTGVVLDPDELGSNANNFWQFLIPGVGLTPVLQFQILISLFVIAIGPVNYLLLRRWQKLNLLPITVGVSAAVVTLALFAYAFLHDGLGVRVRARSYTELDQRRGEAVSWSRLSYYAGVSPSRGLTFSGDTAVYPLRIGSDRRPGGRDIPPSEMEWVAAEPNSADPLPSQHFSSDWLPARVPTQFINVRSRKTAARLNVTPNSQQGGVSKIENHLGARIRWLVLTDSAGHAFQANGIDDDASASVTEVDGSHARASVSKWITDNDLQFPAGAQGNSFQGSQNYSSYPTRSGYYGQSSSTIAAPVEPETILERSLHHASDLPPRSFVAILETSSDVEFGTPSAREESSLHVIVGRW